MDLEGYRTVAQRPEMNSGEATEDTKNTEDFTEKEEIKMSRIEMYSLC